MNFFLDPTDPLMISGGGLPTEYYLFQFHFHWGYESDEGSEHTFNGRKFPLEVQNFHLTGKISNLPKKIPNFRFAKKFFV